MRTPVFAGLLLAALALPACVATPAPRPASSGLVVNDTGHTDPSNTGVGGSTVSLRIWALIAQGEFAEAQFLIAESVGAGLLSQAQATRMLERITLLNTRLGQVPASLQRVKDFPSQLREHTLFQIKQLLEKRDFTLATQSQLKLSEKLIEQQDRLMEKVR